MNSEDDAVGCERGVSENQRKVYALQSKNFNLTKVEKFIEIFGEYLERI